MTNQNGLFTQEQNTEINKLYNFILKEENKEHQKKLMVIILTRDKDKRRVDIFRNYDWKIIRKDNIKISPKSWGEHINIIEELWGDD